MTYTDGNRDLAKNEGVLDVPVNDHDMMASYLTMLLTNDAASCGLGVAARKAIESTYSWERIIKLWLNLM